ncbi:MAG TPA: carboxypeptidase regulatory-like domain-containing protein [Terriglobia bacterium]|nr:carboxypeptidase regulatory-like domain-containing protein [Terriglobia bacterium]
MKTTAVLALLLFIGAVANAAPQAGISTGEIRGTVTDPSGAVIPSATISLISRGTGTETSLTTTDDGTYRALLLKPDTYEIRARMPGLEVAPKSIELTVGQTAVIDFEMKVSSPTAVQVTVESVSPLAEPDRSQQSNTITGDALQQLPIDKRNYLTYSLLMPGVADADALADANDFRPPQAAHSGLSFYGNNGRGNAVSVDGGEANDGAGGVRPTLSQDAVQEFQVNRSNYSVELGGASGGTVNIVSRSGTNALHGTVYGFFRDDALDAADPFATKFENGQAIRVKPPSNRQQFGATLGGALIKQRTFFFGAFEGLDRDESSSVSVLTDESIFNPTPQQEAILATLPPANEAALRQALTSSQPTRDMFRINSGIFPYRGTDYKFSVRLDHLLNPSNQVMFRYNMTNANDSNPNTRALLGASRATESSRLDHTGVLRWQSTISSRTINEFQYQYNYDNYLVESIEPYGPEINVNGFGYFNRDALLPSRLLWRRQQISNKISLSRGAHQFKIGGELLIRSTFVEAHLFFPARFNFGALPGGLVSPALNSTSITAVQAFNLGLAQSFQQAFGNPNVSSTDPYGSAYFEDRWRITRNLTLDLGLRYELDDIRDPIRTDKNNFAPRVAFAWDVRGDHRTTVRGGFGIFYAPSNYAIVQVANALGEVDGKRQMAQVLTSAGTPGVQSSVNIYRTLLAQGVINVPVPSRQITLADLSQFGIVADVDQRPPLYVRFSASPDYASSYTEQASLGVQHVFGSDFVVNANYLFVSGLRILRARDQNLLPVPVNPALGIRVWSLTSRDPSLFVDPSLVQDNVYESTGRSFYHGMTLEIQKRLSSRVKLNANYTLSKAIDDVVDFNTDFQASDQLDLRAERALSSFDQRHKFVAYASIASPAAFTVTPIFRANSGRPFNLLVGTDLNQDFHSTTDRPPFAGRNTGRGPNFWTVDLRVSRSVQLSDSTRIELIGEAFNVFNRLNFRSVNNTVGLLSPPFDLQGRRDLSPSQPLAFTSAFDPRQIQLGARFSF